MVTGRKRPFAISVGFEIMVAWRWLGAMLCQVQPGLIRRWLSARSLPSAIRLIQAVAGQYNSAECNPA